MKNTKSTAQTICNAEKNYPGAAINAADNNRDTPDLIKERTKTLNNNPRNSD